MKKVLYIVGGLVALILVIRTCNSIGSDSNDGPSQEELDAFTPKISSKILSFKNNNISGELGEYLELVSENASINYLKMEKPFARELSQVWEIKLEFKRNEKKLDYDIETINGNYTGLNLDVFDKNGQPIAGVDKISCYSGHDVVDKILTLKSGETGWVKFIKRKGKFEEENVIENWEQLSISSEIGFVKVYEEEEDDEYTNSSGSTISSSEFDQTLDEYEKFINDYIKILKKAKKAEDDPMAVMSIMSDATSMMQNAEKLGEKLSENEGDLSVDQAARLLKLQLKLSKAATEMM